MHPPPKRGARTEARAAWRCAPCANRPVQKKSVSSSAALSPSSSATCVVGAVAPRPTSMRGARASRKDSTARFSWAGETLSRAARSIGAKRILLACNPATEHVRKQLKTTAGRASPFASVSIAVPIYWPAMARRRVSSFQRKNPPKTVVWSSNSCTSPRRLPDAIGSDLADEAESRAPACIGGRKWSFGVQKRRPEDHREGVYPTNGLGIPERHLGHTLFEVHVNNTQLAVPRVDSPEEIFKLNARKQGTCVEPCLEQSIYDRIATCPFCLGRHGRWVLDRTLNSPCVLGRGHPRLWRGCGVPYQAPSQASISRIAVWMPSRARFR